VHEQSLERVGEVLAVLVGEGRRPACTASGAAQLLLGMTHRELRVYRGELEDASTRAECLRAAPEHHGRKTGVWVTTTSPG